MRFVVVGAAGKSGRQVVTEAVQRGIGVTAYVRSAARAEALPAGVTILEGDGRDIAALKAAIAGHDAVVVTAGGRKEPVSGEITQAVIAAMQATGVKRLIAYSAYGAVDGRGFYAWIMRSAAGKIVADKVQQERALAASGLDWTAVRPGVLTDGPKTGKVAAAVDLVLPGFPQISRSDVAAFTIDELQSPRFIGKAVVVHVPR